MPKLLITAALSGVIASVALSAVKAEENAGTLGNENYPRTTLDQPSVAPVQEPAMGSAQAPMLQEGRASAEGGATLAPNAGWAARNGEAAIRELDQQLSRDD
jgi:hypothetical protein